MNYHIICELVNGPLKCRKIISPNIKNTTQNGIDNTIYCRILIRRIIELYCRHLGITLKSGRIKFSRLQEIAPICIIK